MRFLVFKITSSSTVHYTSTPNMEAGRDVRIDRDLKITLLPLDPPLQNRKIKFRIVPYSHGTTWPKGWPTDILPGMILDEEGKRIR